MWVSIVLVVGVVSYPQTYVKLCEQLSRQFTHRACLQKLRPRPLIEYADLSTRRLHPGETAGDMRPFAFTQLASLPGTHAASASPADRLRAGWCVTDSPAQQNVFGG